MNPEMDSVLGFVTVVVCFLIIYVTGIEVLE